jgi:CheY-like chemotaxis protein
MMSPMLKPYFVSSSDVIARWPLPHGVRPSASVALQRAAETRDATLIPILSDINMPGMSGLEMLPMVRAARPDVPVIMITAYGDQDTRRKAIERGAIGLVTKPIDFTLLRQEIDTRLEQAA